MHAVTPMTEAQHNLCGKKGFEFGVRSPKANAKYMIDWESPLDPVFGLRGPTLYTPERHNASLHYLCRLPPALIDSRSIIDPFHSSRFYIRDSIPGLPKLGNSQARETQPRHNHSHQLL